MKSYALTITALAVTLLVTSCGTPMSDTGKGAVPVNKTPTLAAKAGVVTAEQMKSIDASARALAAEDYDAAADAGYYTFKNLEPTQDRDEMADARKEKAKYFDAAKVAFDKGCQLVPERKDEYSVIYSNIVCDGESAPTLNIVAKYRDGKISYLYADEIKSKK